MTRGSDAMNGVAPPPHHTHNKTARLCCPPAAPFLLSVTYPGNTSHDKPRWALGSELAAPRAPRACTGSPRPSAAQVPFLGSLKEQDTLINMIQGMAATKEARVDAHGGSPLPALALDVRGAIARAEALIARHVEAIAENPDARTELSTCVAIMRFHDAPPHLVSP